MKFVAWLSHYLARNEPRNVPDCYIKIGFRRLAPTVDDVVGRHCYNCRHAVAYVTWHCDLGVKDAIECMKVPHGKWERCCVMGEVTKADIRAGEAGSINHWVGLPDGREK